MLLISYPFVIENLYIDKLKLKSGRQQIKAKFRDYNYRPLLIKSI